MFCMLASADEDACLFHTGFFRHVKPGTLLRRARQRRARTTSLISGPRNIRDLEFPEHSFQLVAAWTDGLKFGQNVRLDCAFLAEGQHDGAQQRHSRPAQHQLSFQKRSDLVPRCSNRELAAPCRVPKPQRALLALVVLT